jgi:Tetratricopeptide repeat.
MEELEFGAKVAMQSIFATFARGLTSLALSFVFAASVGLAPALSEAEEDPFLHVSGFGMNPDVLEKDIARLSVELKKKPNNANLYGQRALNFFALNRCDEAVSDYSKAIELAPDCLGLWRCRGTAYLVLERWKEAESDLSHVIDSQERLCTAQLKKRGVAGTYSGFYILRARALVGLKKYEAAKLDILRNCPFGRKNSQGYDFKRWSQITDAKELSQVLESLGDLESAEYVWLSYYNATSDFYPKQFFIDYSRSLSEIQNEYLISENRLKDCLNDKSAASFTRLRLMGETSQFLKKLIWRKHLRQEVSDIEPLMIRYIELQKAMLDTAHGDVHMIRCRIMGGQADLADFYADAGDPRCERLYLTLSQDEYFKGSAWREGLANKYAKFLARCGRDQEAEKYFQISVRGPYKDSRWFFDYAGFLTAKGDLGRSLLLKAEGQSHVYKPKIRATVLGRDKIDMRSLMSIPPMPPRVCNASTYFEMAKTCRDIALVNQANAYIKKALSLNPPAKLRSQITHYRETSLPHCPVDVDVEADYQFWFARQGVYLISINVTDSREHGIENWIKKDPNYALPYVSLARLEREEGNYQEAAEYLRKAIVLQPKLVVAWVEEGNLQRDRKRWSEAKEAYSKALEFDPSNQLAKRELSSILKQL